MYPLHSDMLLNEQQRQIVLDYISEVGFCLPGTSPQDFTVVPLAKYVGWNFQSEDLEAYAVGLKCIKPGFEKHHTFIRMSYGQLMAIAEAPRLPVNDPVLATDTLRMQRWWDKPTGPTRTGVDAYATDDGSVPGVDMDLTQLEDTLSDIINWAQQGHGPTDKGQFDFAVDLGVLLAGRYPRLKYYQQQQKLLPEQIARLTAFEAKATALAPTLESLGLPTLETLKTPERRKHAEHNS